MRRRSQIATILTLIIALIFLFMAFTINLGKVAKKKTFIDNACDSAGLLLASGLGSLSNLLRQELGIYGNATNTSEWNWELIQNLLPNLAMIAAGIALAWTGVGVGIAGIGVVGLGLLTAGMGAYSVAETVRTTIYIEAGLMREASAKFQNMSVEQRLFEGAIQAALFSTVDDPRLVPDRFDVDRDGIKFPDPLNLGRIDKIPRFNHYYFQRLNSLPQIGGLVEEFYNFFFNSNPELFLTRETESFEAEFAYLLFPDGTPVVQWLKNNFRPFLDEMERYGYRPEQAGRSFFRDADRYCADGQLLNQLERLFLDLEGGQGRRCDGTLIAVSTSFQNVIKTMYGMSREQLMASFETWFAQFYNEGGPDNWWNRMGYWQDVYIPNWISLLQERRGQVISCVGICQSPGASCSVPADTGRGCCSWYWNVYYDYTCPDCSGGTELGGCPPCPSCTPCPTCIPPVTCCSSSCNPNWEYTCTQDWDCVGAMQTCCSGCRTNCRPTAVCNTPTGGTRNCCDSACDLSTGCNSTRIDAYITRLQQLQALIGRIRSEITDIYFRYQDARNDPWVRRAIYVWQDVVGKEARRYSTAVPIQNPAHMVYVRLEMREDLDPSSGIEFRLPHITQRYEWWGLTKETFVSSNSAGTNDNGTGSFRITVGRYDEDVAKQGPLRNFWRFRFRRGAGDEVADLATLRRVASNFTNLLDDGEAVVNVAGRPSLDPLISQEDFNTLESFCRNNGIVASVRVNYGPGFNRNPNDPASGFPGTADERNRDIYIVTRER